jgi:diguanylate cyclase (GGDEF)-like protein
MISLKKYLDSVSTGSESDREGDEKDILPTTIAAYGSALREMGNCGIDACPALGENLKRNLSKLERGLSVDMSREKVDATETKVREHLQDWGMNAARQNQQRTREVRELLIVMAHTAESVGERDQRCAGQMNLVTKRLERIASLDDLAEVRASIEESAADLKSSIERMSAEGKAAIEELQGEVSNYQARLEEAEHIASSDRLTGLRSRLWVENQIESRIASGSPLCIAIADIDDFKKVNDKYGHMTGDELLKQFSTEMKSACRSTDAIGRWGGDEFIILLECGLGKAKAQMERAREWVCGNYKIELNTGPITLRVNASLGLAEYRAPETMKELLSRADAAMYEHKAACRANDAGSGR